jgi:hypothetical protein
VGDGFCIARVVDQSPEFLRFLSQTGLKIGTRGSLVDCDAKLKRMTIRVGEVEKTLARESALKLMIR